MDSLTQICLGAAVGEAYLGRKTGNKAILWGAILGTVPDLDVLFKPLFNYVGGLVMHRGLSHSMLFFILSSPIFAWVISKIHPGVATRKQWIWFSFWVMFTHAILDSFTSWGTQLWWPHPMRVAWNNIFVADLLYTLPLLICLIWLMFKRKDSAVRRNLNYWGLGISSLYMIITFGNKYLADCQFEESLAAQNIEFSDYSTRPTPLNSILWGAVVESETEFYLGYYSLLSDSTQIKWTEYPKNHNLMEPYTENSDWQKLARFTGGEYIVEDTGSDTLFIHDLRFGKMKMPNTPSEWVFTYYGVKHGDNSISFSQKELPSEKFSGDEMKVMMGGLWRNILGEDPSSLSE
ncbi:MAG: metal-dependent hydrolase [Flavobacteriales bacterium]